MAQEGRVKKRKWKEEVSSDEDSSEYGKKKVKSRKKIEKIIFNNSANHYPYIDGDVL